MPTIVDALKEKLKVSNGQTIAEVLSAASDIKSDVIADTIPGLKGSGGGSGSGGSDVVFYDYDGAVVASYSADEFKALSAFPENPVHEGLTAQGWNWDISDAKEYVNKYGKLNVGQMYITDDGKTRFYINLISRTKSGSVDSTVHVTFSASSIGSVTIDWGDGNSETNTATERTSYSHTYNADGDYVITFDVSDGEIVFSGTSGNPAFNPAGLINVFFGSGVTSIGDYAFSNCFALSEITIPDSVTSIGDYAFSNCSALSEVTIPDSVTSIGKNAFGNCYSLSKLTIPDSLTSIGSNAFSNCRSLSKVTLSDSLTSIGSNAFSGCSALSEVTIPDSLTSIGSNVFKYCSALSEVTIPDSLTSIVDYVFDGCSSLSKVTLSDSLTSIGSGAFSGCSALSEVTIPDSVTSIGEGAFQYCSSLSKVTIPNSVTSIGKSAFISCSSLSKVTIPDSVTSIGDKAFANTLLSNIVIDAAVPPTLGGDGVFNTNAYAYQIIVPYSEDHSVLNAYKTATNWSKYASNIIEADPE